MCFSAFLPLCRLCISWCSSSAGSTAVSSFTVVSAALTREGSGTGGVSSVVDFASVVSVRMLGGSVSSQPTWFVDWTQRGGRTIPSSVLTEPHSKFPPFNKLRSRSFLIPVPPQEDEPARSRQSSSTFPRTSETRNESRCVTDAPLQQCAVSCWRVLSEVILFLEVFNWPITSMLSSWSTAG